MSMHSASGYAKRKIKLEKNKALSKILEKVPKINDLFKKKSASVEGSSDENQSCEGTPESAIIDIDPESAEVLPLNQSGFSKPTENVSNDLVLNENEPVISNDSETVCN